MAVTLKLQHTFTTRVVYSSDEVADLRELMKESLVVMYKQADSQDRKVASLARAGIEVTERCMQMGDEDMLTFLTREAFKCGFREFIKPELKDLNVTKLGPIQTQVVKRG